MDEHAPEPIRAKILAMKLNTFLRFVFIMKWFMNEINLDKTVCKLALVTVATVHPIRLNPILAHFGLIFSLVALLVLCRRRL